MGPLEEEVVLTLDEEWNLYSIHSRLSVFQLNFLLLLDLLAVEITSNLHPILCLDIKVIED